MTNLRRLNSLNRLLIGVAAFTILLSLVFIQLVTARLGTEESDGVLDGERLQVATGVTNGKEWSLSVSLSNVGECISFSIEGAAASGGGCGFGLLEGNSDIAVGILTDHAAEMRYVIGLTRAEAATVRVEDASRLVGEDAALSAGHLDGQLLSAFVVPVPSVVVIQSVTALGLNDEIVAVETIPRLDEPGDPAAPVTDHDDPAHDPAGRDH